MDLQTFPDVARVLAERQELIRRCACRVVADHQAGRGNDPHRLTWAQSVIASTPPLQGPLSDGVVRQEPSTEATQ